MSDDEEYGGDRYGYHGEDSPEFGGVGEEDEGRYREEETEFVAGFEKPLYATKVTEFQAKGYDVTRTLEEAAMIKISTIFSDPGFSSLSRDKKGIETWIISNLPERVTIDHVNPTAVVLTAKWYMSKEKLNKSNFEKFYKTYKDTGINKIDLLRYLRLFEK